MKVSIQILAIVIISLVFLAGVQAQTDPADNQNNTGSHPAAALALKDQNQNQGDVQNRETNRIIHGPGFVDTDKDGFNDNAPDHDGDGVPNGRDADYQGAGKGNPNGTFTDVNGDGIADPAAGKNGQGYRNSRSFKKGYGPADGSGNRGVRPQDGSGYGPAANSDSCDGTGPNGRQFRQSNRK